MKTTVATGDSSTQILIEAARAGNRSAFDELTRRLAKRVEARIASRFGTRLRGALELEDVRQETFLRAFESIGRFEGQDEGAFLRWIGGIAEHVILKAVERQRYRGTVPLESDLVAEEPSGGARLRRHERFERLDRALAGLSPDYRRVIVLARIRRLPSSEIARLMGRSPAAVAQLLARALRKLRDAFGDTESFHLPPGRLREEGERDACE